MPSYKLLTIPREGNSNYKVEKSFPQMIKLSITKEDRHTEGPPDAIVCKGQTSPMKNYEKAQSESNQEETSDKVKVKNVL